MDAATARKEILEANQQLAMIDERRQSLLAWVAGLEGWMKLHPNDSKQLSLPIKTNRPSKPKGAVSFRGAIIGVLQGARGEPLHSKEILARARAAGADTRSKTPERMVELVMYNLANRDGKPVEKVAARTWRWSENGR